MRLDMHTATALCGLAVPLIGGVMLLEAARAVFVPVLGMIGGIAGLTLASRERLNALEERIAEAEWRAR